MRTLLSMLLLCLAGCESWPRYEHLTGANEEALPVGTDAGSTVDVNWVQVLAEYEPNDVPGDPLGLFLGEGLMVNGYFEGGGWDAYADSSNDSSCGAEDVFPPTGGGNYTGDVEWFSVRALSQGTLCASVLIWTESLRYDLIPYELNDCDEPDQAWVLDGELVGLGLGGLSDGWALRIPDGVAMGVGLAGYWPEFTEDVGWRLGISLMPNAEDGGPGICPLLPEGL